MNSSKVKRQPNVITSEQLKPIKIFLSFRSKIQQALKYYQYKEELSHKENISKLCTVLQNLMELSPDLKQKFITSFKQFLSSQQNIPIQINFKRLKYDQLCSLFEQWQISLKQPPLIRPTQRLYSIEHRNILFNRIFVEERQNIEMYFQTLSQKKMLKGVDIYQLLVDILSHYYLYEYSTDNETFFQKVNSFNNFLQVVQKFIHNQRRIIIDNKSKDFQYIKLYEFQALIYFWQQINLELQLRSDRRFSNRSQQVQTEQLLVIQKKQSECQTQKQKQKQLNLHETINLTLKNLNKLTQEQMEPQKLQIIQNICESLRKQKIQLIQYQKTRFEQKIISDKRNQSSQRSYANQFSPSPFNLNSNFQQIRQDRQIRNQRQRQLQLQKTQRKSMRDSTKVQQIKNFNSKQQEDPVRSNQKYNRSNEMNKSNQNSPKKSISNRNSSQRKRLQSIQLCEQKDITISQIDSKFQQYSHFQKNDKYSMQKNPSTVLLHRNQIQADHTINYLQRNETQSSNINPSLLKLLQGIFAHYYTRRTGFIDLQNLNKFFIDIGIIQQSQTKFTFDLIKKKIIINANKIGIVQFLQIMGHIMKQDQDLTYQVVYEFYDIYIKSTPILQQDKKDSRFQKLFFKHEGQRTVYQESKPRYTNLRQQRQNSSVRKRYKYCEQTPKFKKTNQINPISQMINPTSHINDRYSPNKTKKVSIPILYFPKSQKQKVLRYF